MAAYSMELRLRVLRDADAGLPSDELAEKYSVSRAWVDRLKQRRRETGEVAPRKQTRWRTPILHGQLPQLEALIREQAGSHAGGIAGGAADAGESADHLPSREEARLPI
jgi:transposase